jgi:hypothetical protein
MRPSVVNNAIATLRAIFQEAISTGARFNNPAAGLARIKLRPKRLDLPSREQFLRFVEEIRTAGARQSKDCANLSRYTLRGSIVGTRDLEEALAFDAEGRVKATIEQLPLESINDVFSRLRQGKVNGRVVLNVA